MGIEREIQIGDALRAWRGKFRPMMSEFVPHFEGMNETQRRVLLVSCCRAFVLPAIRSIGRQLSCSLARGKK